MLGCYMAQRAVQWSLLVNIEQSINIWSVQVCLPKSTASSPCLHLGSTTLTSPEEGSAEHSGTMYMVKQLTATHHLLCPGVLVNKAYHCSSPALMIPQPLKINQSIKTQNQLCRKVPQTKQHTTPHVTQRHDGQPYGYPSYR